MRKILAALLGIGASVSFADSVYLNEHYAVALKGASFESTTNTIQAKTLTPIVYEKYYLPSGVNVVMSCNSNNQAVVSQIDSYDVKVPVSIGNSSKIVAPCDNTTMPDMMWTGNDDYKIKSDNIKEIDKSAFSILPFTTKNVSENGQITGASSNGQLTIISVSKARYFDNAQFFGTINGKTYFLQSTSDSDQFIISGANFDKLLVTTSSGQLITSIEFTSLN